MRKTILAVMDSGGVYAGRFMELVNRKRTSPFDVHAFTDFEALEDYAKKRPPEVLLISEQDLKEEILTWPVEQIAVLTERPPGAEVLRDEPGEYHAGEEEGAALLEQLPRISKYQSSSSILKELAAIRAEAEHPVLRTGEGDEAVLKQGMKTIGVFSPVGRCLKTSFAAAMGQCLAREKPTLFLSLDACTGFEDLLHEEYDRNLSDAVYYIRRGEKGIMRKLLPMVKQIGGLHYLPPFSGACELFSVSGEEWRILIDEIRTDSVYEALVMDLGEIPLIHPSVLEECDRVYMPLLPDPWAKAKIAEFDALMKREAMEPVAAKIRRLRIVPEGMPESMDRWYERLPYSGLGRLAGECIARDHL